MVEKRVRSGARKNLYKSDASAHFVQIRSDQCYAMLKHADQFFRSPKPRQPHHHHNDLRGFLVTHATVPHAPLELFIRSHATGSLHG